MPRMTTLAPAALHSRRDDRAADRVRLSVATPDTAAGLPTARFPGWLAERTRAHRFAVTRVPLAELDGWSTDPGTGDLAHASGRFFTVHGLAVAVESAAGPIRRWQQPIIDQPEVGVLGILAKEFDGVLHVLMQAKMEPGNPNLVQLSPTVQATRSNYTGVHRGGGVRYLEYFLDPRRGRPLADALQSEHGSWFLGKYNRNTVVQTEEDPPLGPDHCWLTLGQVGRLLRADNVVNMDARIVLACLPGPDDERRALRTDAELASWLAGERAVRRVHHRRVPLRITAGWTQDDHRVARPDGRFFQVVGVRVQAPSREVGGWSQPLVEPTGPGVVAFVTRRFDGVAHYLVAARAEPGFRDSVQVGPTVQCVPGNHAAPPPFLDLVLGAAAGDIRYDVLHSEEGGRFLGAVSRHLVVDADRCPDAAPLEPPPGFCWATAGQLDALVGRADVTVQARTLVAALRTGAVAP